MTHHSLLLDETPVIILPSLVRALGGIPEAVFVQQVHYRARAGREFDGHRWAIETKAQWAEACCLTDNQLRRAIHETVKAGVIVRFTPQNRLDTTARTRVDYGALNGLLGGPDPHVESTPPPCENHTLQRRVKTTHSKEEGCARHDGGEKAAGAANSSLNPDGTEKPF